MESGAERVVGLRWRKVRQTILPHPSASVAEWSGGVSSSRGKPWSERRPFCHLPPQPVSSVREARQLLLAVNHGGDSDSTGAITGNILGTLLGKEAIPGRWLERLELRDEIEAVAVDMYRRFVDPGAIGLDMLVKDGDGFRMEDNPAYESQAADLERYPPW